MLRITYSRGGRKVAEFECGTEGGECAIRDSGRHAKVSMWFNGSKLVVLETRGGQIVKRRFGVSRKGGTLGLEIIPIMPAGKTETSSFRRVRPWWATMMACQRKSGGAFWEPPTSP